MFKVGTKFIIDEMMGIEEVVYHNGDNQFVTKDSDNYLWVYNIAYKIDGSINYIHDMFDVESTLSEIKFLSKEE